MVPGLNESNPILIITARLNNRRASRFGLMPANCQPPVLSAAGMIEEDAVVVKAVFDIGLGDAGSSRGPGDWRSGVQGGTSFWL
jgi:hypothetical protein